MARSNGSVERRVSTLERLAKEDRVRWLALTKYLKACEARWQKNDERWQKNDERWRASEQKSDERWQKQQDSIDATLKILHRMLEGTP